MRTLGRLVEGQEAGTLKAGKEDERKARDIEIRKKIKQKDERKEERREDMKKKANVTFSEPKLNAGKRKDEKDDVSQGECMDTKRTWTCPKCKTENAESYKFCMDCANRSPKRSSEEIASASSEPPAYRRRTDAEEEENQRKRKAEEGSLKKEGGETRGDIDKTMNVDMMEEEEFQERKKELRENKVPLIILQGTNWKRIAQIGVAQNIGGEYYIWEMPRKMNNATINNKMRNIGGPGIIVKDTKIWTNSKRIKERVDEEMRKRQVKIRGGGVQFADDKDAKVEEYKLGRAVEEAIREELTDRESEDICFVEEQSKQPGILYIEDGDDKHVYYCDSWGQYWDEITNKKLDSKLVEAARLDEIKGLYQYRVYNTVNIEECYEKTGKSPIRVRWLDINKGNEKNKEYRSRLVAQEIKRDNREDLFAATPPVEAKKLLFSWAVTEGVGYEKGKEKNGMKIDFIDIKEGFLPGRGKKRGICRAAQ